MKTWDDYMNDPDIIDEPMALREIHAIRFKIQDERIGMTAEEYNAIVNQRAKDFLAPLGKTLRYDLAGEGKLKLK